ncbi:MAG TPA: tRNA (adenosine(37)-N6)-threonylcarbamoyltransferase complex ATPase subunit type 1 TsaE [Nitrospira sp.]|nr:tRNA (adenosine(37)-N6)-threonylcarbamoyltransferase complex ATPase subunit type 1 TsaE [Nitrospira sp.]
MPSKPQPPRRKLTRPRGREVPAAGTRIWRQFLPSPRHTDRLGRTIGSVLRGGESLALSGTLGAGKTALVRGIANGLGASPRAVSSPSFVLLHEYRGRLPLAHLDLYRLSSTKEAEGIGLDDYLSGPTVVAVEWADKAPGILPDDRLEMELRHRTVQSRNIELRATGPVSAALLARVKRAAMPQRKHPRSRPPRRSSKGISRS